MLTINDITNNNRYITFGNRKNAQLGLEKSLERFKNKIIAEEKAMTNGILREDIVSSIEDKFSSLWPKILRIKPHYVPELKKPLDDAVSCGYDITDSYIALGDFEKRLSQINP